MGKIQAIEKGMLFFWKAPKGKIEPKNLGWVCPDGTINFATSETANNYAKNAVVKALNAPKPYEKSVVVNDRRIIFEHNGTENNCIVPPDAQGTWVHGHPDTFAVPFSATDYSAFMSVKNIDKAVIYNSAGESSSLVKVPKQSFLDKLLLKIIPKENYENMIMGAKIGQCYGGYNSALLKNCSSGTTMRLNKLAMQKLIALAKGDTQLAEKYATEYTQLYNKEMEAALKDEKTAKRIHNFWTKYAKKLGIEYSSNFSNLT